jgi:hypothetical protein
MDEKQPKEVRPSGLEECFFCRKILDLVLVALFVGRQT